MAKVLLIAPLTEEYSGIEDYGAPALGVWRIASFLAGHDHEAVVYDCNLQSEDDLARFLKDCWDIIGISVLADTLKLSLDMFDRLRSAQPQALLVAGGVEATLNYQEIFDLSPADAVVLGEGEGPMAALASGQSPGAVPGLVLRRFAEPITGDVLWRYYEHLDFAQMGWREYWARNAVIGDEAGQNRLVRIVTTTHCNRGCSFCSVTRFREHACGRRVLPAFLSGPQVGVLIQRILDQLPETTHIYFIEDTFLPTGSRMDDFCEALEPFRQRVKFLVQTDTDRLTREIVQRLAEVGVVHISCGVESCSRRIRRIVGKPQDSDKIESIIAWCREFGIRCYYLVILFVPESTVADLRINYETLTRWQREGNVGISVMPYMFPYRGAAVWYSDFQFEYDREKLANGRTLKRATVIWPADPEVRRIMQEFRRREPEYLRRLEQEEGHGRRSKDYTGRMYIRLLGDLLEERGEPF